MFPATLLRRLTAFIVVLALAAPAWTVCRTVAAAEPVAGMACCHESDEASSGAIAGDCCRVQPDDPASSPVVPTLSPTVRTTALALVSVPLVTSGLGAQLSHDQRAEADGRFRPKTAPYLLDSVLLI